MFQGVAVLTPWIALLCLATKTLCIQGGVKVGQFCGALVGKLLAEILVEYDPREPFVPLACPSYLVQVTKEVGKATW